MASRILHVGLACAALAASAASTRTDGARAGQAAPNRPVLNLSQRPAETRHLTITASTSAPSVARGARIVLFLDVVPKPKMHVYAPDQDDYIPISLTLAPDQGVRAQPPRYPPAEKFFFEPLDETQRVYSKPFRITQAITVTGPPAGGTLTIAGTVRYQACDDAICYVPETVPVRWDVSFNR